jgi:hypothetical protein
MFIKEMSIGATVLPGKGREARSTASAARPQTYVSVPEPARLFQG